MKDKRKDPRVAFERGFDASIMAIDGTWQRSCIMKDASDGGARLILGDQVDKLGSNEFFLLLSSTGLAYRRCNIVWINGEEVGIEFVRNGAKAPKQLSRPPAQAPR